MGESRLGKRERREIEMALERNYISLRGREGGREGRKEINFDLGSWVWYVPP